MRLTTLAVMATAAVLTFATIATAQTTPGTPTLGRQGRAQGRARSLPLASVPVKTIDTLIGLTAEQKTKVESIQTQLASDLRALRPAKGQPADPTARDKRAQLVTKANEDLSAVLTPEQRDKLKAAVKDLAPVLALGVPPALAVDLKLTADQKAKIADLVKDARAQAKGADATTRRAKMADAKDKAMQLLTDDQKKIVEKYEADHQKRGAKRTKPPKK